jgi:hypothetical protein
MTVGELAALAWIAEGLSRQVAQSVAGAQLLHVDFDRFLDEPNAGLSKIALHFNIHASESEVTAACNGPTMNRYAKAPEHAYSRDLRARILGDARVRMREELRQALSFISKWADNDERIARLLS